MTSRDFCFWLQGFFELQSVPEVSTAQAAAIKRHLDMVFAHEIDPGYGDAKAQAKLNALHKPSIFNTPGVDPITGAPLSDTELLELHGKLGSPRPRC